ncbi:synergin gamma-like [Planococcus citri]|uniref:synergin gamma-like n=1 Tax=Planococcus citri TaxID=170843 RepID=UPI0031F98C3D
MQNKQQEYFKQREKLKFISPNNVTKKVLDPDIMIKQLISDKETFKFNVKSESTYVLPKWLKLENGLVPKVYEQVWQAVKLAPMNQFCDTQIITQLFTTSGLPLEKLGYLWSITNVATPGFLTQQELYVMLVLIALVQTGYPVKDISILKGINHPILPQLDYSFLNITVANPAINRSVIKNSTNDSRVLNNTPATQSIPTVQFSGPIATPKHYENIPSFSKPPKDFSKPIDLIASDFKPKEMPKINITSELKNLSVNDTFPQPLKFDISNSCSNNILKPAKPNNIKNYDYLGLSDVSSNLEPKSLDLPIFETAQSNGFDDDEFTEFQSATVVTTNDEYADFQSASPLVKYELNNFTTDTTTDLICDQSIPNITPDPVSLSNDEQNDVKTGIDADKYDVFRSLMEHPKNKEVPKKEEEVEDFGEDEEEEDEDNFGDFFGVNVEPAKDAKELSIREKCLDACLRLLQEGLRVFSSISNEQTLSEVLSDERGYRYFNQLKIVYETSQRFQRQFSNQHVNDALQILWGKLTSYTKYIPSDELLDEIPTEDDIDGSLCKLCETKCDVNCVRYAGNNYHVTCINLFLHFVEDSKISAMLNI